MIKIYSQNVPKSNVNTFVKTSPKTSTQYNDAYSTHYDK